MVNEKNTDYFVRKLLDDTDIKYTSNGSDIKEINEILKTSSKNQKGNQGFPEFVGKSEDFIIVIEDKANIENQVCYDDKNEQVISLEPNATVNFAENGALYYAKRIVEGTNFKKVFAFGCSGGGGVNLKSTKFDLYL